MAVRPPADDSSASGGYTWLDFWMLLVIVVGLITMFLGGLVILVNATDHKAADLVAVLSPGLAAVGTVAGGIFGYSLGTRGSTRAHEAATRATEEAGAARRDAAAIAEAATPLSQNVQRIITQARAGQQSQPGAYTISAADLQTLEAAATAVQARAAASSAVPAPPTPTLTKSHTGDFTNGQQASYTLIVSNPGPASLSAPLVVTDFLPAGLSFVGGSGSGFTCTASGQTVICESGTPLAVGASAAITLTVTPTNTTSRPQTVINTATLAWASGAISPVSDPTTIRP
jgi:uncharacterized repeat protein (TIGR01451 family)